METSDSEYFESADEDFDSDEECKNKALIKDNVTKFNVTESINKLHISSNPNENPVLAKEQDRKENTHFSVSEYDYNTNKQIIKTLAPAEIHENNTNDDDRVIQTGTCPGNSDGLTDTTDANLWNDDEGWDVDDEIPDLNLPKIDCSKAFVRGTEINPKEVSSEEKQDEKNMWDDDQWENWESVNEEKLNEENIKSETDNSSSASSNQLWKSWGNWGVTSILSTASQGVSTLTHSVSQGFSTVLETGIGAPDPEKLAMLNHAEKKSAEPTESSDHLDEVNDNKNLLGFGLSNIGNLVSGVSKLVESTSTKVISGGLDTLETIGKKTMEVIQDGDPGLKKKRAFLNLEGEKPVLSQVLREAKEKAEQENKTLQEKHFTKKVNYESIFDDHQGLVHLEALEMLSKQCDMKLQLLTESSTGKALLDIQETLDQVKELCELPDEEEDEQITTEELKEKLKSAIAEIGINISYAKLISLWEETECWLNNISLNVCDEHEMHQQAVETLAQLTAIAVEQFHRAGELLLIKDHHSTADEADSLVQLTITLTSLLGIVAAKFSDKMNTKVTETTNKENINSLITNIFFEAANSSSYIQDAFQLLVPVLQMGAV